MLVHPDRVQPDHEVSASGRPGRGVNDLAFLILDVAAFVAGTLLITWGLFLFAFLCLGGFSLGGMMHQLANLSSRYLAADAERVRSFQMLLVVSHLILSCAIIFLRRHRIPHV
ncbi:hypothetical protein [Sphingobium sp. CFD-2]|uniref:hypothetical protein n=1 Tax=Sphingobium sp. CFD-2 TaxID=2878542 RepID=UPI00214CD22A|nr:hypothetical protein [Sphingobium sp. CFD-2]